MGVGTGFILEPARIFVGLDLGQSQDPSALSVVERAEVFPGAMDWVSYERRRAQRFRVLHLERLKYCALNQSPDVRSADPFRHSRGQQDRHARVLVFRTRNELQRGANRVLSKLRKRRVLASQFIIVRQLVRQPRDVGQQMSHRHVVAMVGLNRRQSLVIRAKNPGARSPLQPY